MIYLTVDYKTHDTLQPWKWLGAKFTVTPCMDNSSAGMSFVYCFNSPEDATVFRLLFAFK